MMKSLFFLPVFVLVASGCVSATSEGVLFNIDDKGYLLTRECVENSMVMRDQGQRSYVHVALNDVCAKSLADFLNSHRGGLLSVSVNGRDLSRSLPIMGEFQASSLRIASPDEELANEAQRVLSPRSSR
ncbi:hypothetical protein LF844_18830 [Metapseudomonas lalkuanensis]|uniref:hypothetical protein n=1 Tax=Metapseudomonas lalkuanensis TaxID=2604832 RepID=UPI001CF415F2|nr:hypothetical protein [Pseudomonas lalkuanensis]UCO96715.1 hypothetical protein LF844_18830 [Pseudomonas lalkuanensis]